jgi:hypothetical protein
MKYEDLKQEIAAIADIAAAVPEAFRTRCFELLLQHLLDSANLSKPPAKHEKKDDKPAAKDQHESKDNSDATAIPTPSQIKIVMQKTGVAVDDLKRIMIFEDDQVHFVQEPTTKKIARGQIEWSLLLALKNGIESNNLTVDPENVRSICQEKGFYDKANFNKNFKTVSNSALFQGPMESQGQAQKLSTEGQKELGKLIKELAAASE